jgi:multicomponent Na+:H+ antiporter subunit D
LPGDVTDIVPLPVVVPLVAAASMALASAALPRRLVDAISIAVTVITAVLCGVLLESSLEGPVVHWFGSWHPANGISLGIPFVVDPIGAGTASLAALITTAAFVFSWEFFAEDVMHRYNILILVFLAGMIGFSFAGDLFNLFVFFELMSVAAYALTGFKIESPGPLQGGLAFAVSNSAGSFFMLTGIALVYARTGALNFAQAGEALADGPIDGLVLVAFAMICAGLLTKAAVAPWHLWLADAHAVAPTPVCALFSGVMISLGLLGVARVYWTVFEGALSSAEGGLRPILVGFGVASALVGSVMCFAQQHLKRLLAFSSVAHMGLFLAGVGALEHVGMAGSAVYVLSHGGVKAGLFLCVGMVLHRLGSVDEEHLRGRGRDLPLLGALMALGGLALAGVPPFGPFLGKSMIEEAVVTVGYEWIPAVFIITSILTGGALLRAAARMFIGWGPDEIDRFESETYGEHESRETKATKGGVPAVMWIPALLLILVGLGTSFVPGMASAAEEASVHFQDRESYASRVLEDDAVSSIDLKAKPPSVSSIAFGAASAIGAIGVAALALFRRKLPSAMRRWISEKLGIWVRRLRALHSGIVTDYIAWLTIGTAMLGGLFALYLR